MRGEGGKGAREQGASVIGGDDDGNGGQGAERKGCVHGVGPVRRTRKSVTEENQFLYLFPQNEITKTNQSVSVIRSYVLKDQFVQLFLYDYASFKFTGYVDHLNQY